MVKRPLSPRAQAALATTPVVVAGGYALLLALPATRFGARVSLQENYPVELLTFAFLFLGGVLAGHRAWHGRRRGDSRLVRGFYALFAAGLLLTAMDEVAWGQTFFGFPTPFGWDEANRQHELTLHNLGALHSQTATLHLVFGLGGLFGVALWRHRALWRVGAAPVLAPWFLTIALLSGLRLTIPPGFGGRGAEVVLGFSAEVNELLIGGAALLFVWLNQRHRAA